MGKKRGFFAEINYQKQQDEKRRQLQAAAAARAHAARVREAERAQRASERAQAAAARADAQTRALLEKEAAQSHVASMLAEVEARNAALGEIYEEIDGILAATLEVDDYVDLESLKASAIHPPFDPGSDGVQTPPVPTIVYPPEPVYVEPPKPSGLFASKKKHAELIAQSQAAHAQMHAHWKTTNAVAYEGYLTESRRREEVERGRVERLAAREAQYKEECEQRESEASARNDKLTKLINDLAFDVESAIQEYVDIVLSNSVYPAAFPVDYEQTFDLPSRELTLTVTIPSPSAIPTIKEYRYVKAKDEIVESALPIRAQKDRYANAVSQVAIRTLSEIFEADRRGKIHSISLTVTTNTISPATGQPTSIPLVIVAADRESFSQFDLTGIVPLATLEHLGAAVSRSPFDLTPVDTSRGVRARKQ